jgi:ribosomal protein S18 acetylase RimI-like enzyme
MKLISSPANFRNIYLLEKEWVDYRRKKGLKIYNEGYCLETIWRNQSKAERYEKIIKGESDYTMKIKLNHIRIRRCEDTDINSIMEFQERIFAGMKDLTLLRRNTREMFEACVSGLNLTLGLYYEDTLIGIGILYSGRGTTEDLSVLMKKETLDPDKSVNLKLVAIEEKYRGNGLQLALMSILERYACINDYDNICATVAPKNTYSKVNFEKRGYTFDHNMLKYGGTERSLYYKKMDVCKKVINTLHSRVESLAGSYKDPDAAVEGIELEKFLIGSIDIASTGDILEYVDTDCGEIYYGILLKNKKTLSVCIFVPEEEKIQMKEFSERIGVLQLNQIYINTEL